MSDAVTMRSGSGEHLAAADTPMLSLQGLGRRFGDRWAVRDMSLEIRAGEVVGFLGPNGAGKTTTVRMLAALIAPSEGRAFVGGQEVREAAETIRARVGVLTESPGLYEKLSAEANLHYFGRLHRLSSTVRAERSERLLRLFGLWDRRGDVAGTFSKGMRQKLAIARALLHEPDVLFLDEPTAALDPEAAFIVREAIGRLRGAGRTIVLCTHNLDEADRLSDRIAFLRGGLLRVDTPARLRGVGAGTVEIRLRAEDAPLDGQLDALVAADAALPVVRSATASAVNGSSAERVDLRLPAADASRAPWLIVGVADPDRDTPIVVRTIVEGGGEIVAVRERAATLEEAYFEVMGVRPGATGDVA